VLSDTQAGEKAGTLWLEYPRFERFEDQFRIGVHGNKGVANEDELRIQLDRNYLENIEVNSITPAPDREIKDADWITYVFKINGGSLPFTAYFYVTPQKAGPLSGAFQLQNGNPVSFSQFIYP
jgi:hypothetical protein